MDTMIFFPLSHFSEEFINNVDKFNLTQKTFDFILSNLPKIMKI